LIKVIHNLHLYSLFFMQLPLFFMQLPRGRLYPVASSVLGNFSPSADVSARPAGASALSFAVSALSSDAEALSAALVSSQGSSPNSLRQKPFDSATSSSGCNFATLSYS
jgi:hypothetical protein